MQREDIKTLFGAMTPNTKVSISFHAPFTDRDGEYAFVEAKKGRGRGGSLSVVLRGATPNDQLDWLEVDGATKAFGTPVADYIKTIVVGGKVSGDVEAAAPSKPKNPNAKENAAKLREVFLQLAELRGNSIRVAFTSSDPSLDGEWAPAKAAVKHPGRFGQVSLGFTKTLPDGTETKIELWSYKDVDRIDMIDLLPAKPTV